MEGRQYFGGIACGNVSSDDGWAAIHHAIGQCVSGEYSCGHCAVCLLGCVQAEAESELLSGGGDDALWRLLSFSDGGFSFGFRGRAVTLGGGGVFAANLTKGCDSVHIAIVENLSTLAVMTVILMFTGWDMPPLTLPAFGNFFYAGAFCTALYFVLQSIGQQSTAPNKAAIIITTESIFAAVFSAILYGERMHFRGYLGCAVIFAAMALAEKPVQERK